MTAVDTEAAVGRLMRFLAVEGVTGREAMIGKELVAALKEAGVPARAIRFDDAHTRIPLPTETGNLIVDLPGRGALAKCRSAALHDAHGHRAAVRRRQAEAAGKKDRQHGEDGARRRQPHGLRGARDAGRRAAAAQARPSAADASVHGARGERPVGGAPCRARRISAARQDGVQLRRPRAADVVIGAVGADRWEVEIFGRASHAGGAPERGISATMIWPRRSPPSAPAAGSAKSEEGRRAPATSARSAAPTAGPPATPPTWSPITCMCAAKAAATTPSSSSRSRRPTRPRSRRRPPGDEQRRARPAALKFTARTDYTRSG